MSDYYVNLSGDFYDQGSGSGSQQLPFNGLAGLIQLIWQQDGLGPLTAGDNVYLRGTGDMSNLNYVYFSDITNWQLGDIITDHADIQQATFRAKVFMIYNSCVYMVRDPQSSNIIAESGKPYYNLTRSSSAVYLGFLDVTIPLMDCGGDDSSGYVSFIGCNQSWVADGTRVCFDGKTVARHCLELYASKLRFENIHFTNCWYHNVYAYIDSIEHIFVNCEVSNSQVNGMGMYLAAAYDTILYRCDIHDNGHYGLYLARGIVVACSFTNNLKSALRGKYNQTVINCLFASNGTSTDSGIILDRDGGFVHSCVIDSSGLHGIEITDGYSQQFIFANRITNSGGYGISARAGSVCDFNVFYNNESGDISEANSAGNDFAAASSGYVDSGAGNFMVDKDAAMRRNSLPVGQSNTAYFTSGLGAVDLQRDQQVSFNTQIIDFV